MDCAQPGGTRSSRTVTATVDATLHVPVDATRMCGVLSGLMRAGRLPATHAAIGCGWGGGGRIAVLKVDAGAAFGGETVVGHAMGFEFEVLLGALTVRRPLRRPVGSRSRNRPR